MIRLLAQSVTRMSGDLPAAPRTESKLAKITDQEGQKGLKMNGIEGVFLELYRFSFLVDNKA